MYAISHAATALVIKRRFPEAPLISLLVAAQLVEVLWVGLSYAGVEHANVVGDRVHLDFLPFSHSVATGLGLSLLTWFVVARLFNRPKLGLALAIAIASHIVLDIVQHEPDITLLPFPWGPRLGLNLQGVPIANLLVELAYGLICWRIFRGGIGLAIAIVIFNVADIPLMFPPGGSGAALKTHPFILPTVVLVQIAATWLAVWWFARPKTAATDAQSEQPPHSLAA